MKNSSIAGEFTGIFEKRTDATSPSEIKDCTSAGVSFDISDNVIKANH